MRAADRYLATLNGFRAWAPPGWALGNSAHEDYLDAVERWRAQHGLAAVCTLDVESRVMVPAP